MSEDRDHDLLVKLDVKVDDIGTKMTDYNQRILIITTALEARLKLVEEFQSKFDDAEELYKWTATLRSNLKFAYALLSLISIPSVVQLGQWIIEIVKKLS